MKTVKDYICPESYNFYYGALHNDRKSYYKLLFENLTAFNEEFEVFGASVMYELTVAFQILKLDVPELFYVQEIDYKIEDEKITVRPSYAYSKGEVLRILEAVNQKYNSFLSTCKNKSPLDKAISIYMLLGSLIKYNDSENSHHQGLPTLLYNEGCCEGIAHAFKYLSDRIGLKSIIVVGQEKDGPFAHAWNAVLIGDRFINIDAIAGAPGSGKSFYSYFGIDDIYEQYTLLFGPNRNYISSGGIVNQSIIKLKLLAHSYRFKNKVTHLSDINQFTLALQNNGYQLFVDFLVFILLCAYRVFLGSILPPILYGFATPIMWLIFIFCELLPLVKFSISAAYYDQFLSGWKKYPLVFFAFVLTALLSFSSYIQISLVFELKQITFWEVFNILFLLFFFITPTHKAVAAFSSD